MWVKKSMEINKIGLFIMVFILLIVGIIFAGSLADSIWTGTEGVYTENESITLANGTAVSLTEDWAEISSVWANHTNVSDGGNLTLLVELQDYWVNFENSETPPTITLNNSIYEGNASYVNYNFQDDIYIRHGTSRVLVNLINIFWALAILAAALWGMMKMGIMDLFK